VAFEAGNGGPDNVVLTGFMGTGKTTVGRILAEQLGYEFVDTDEMIESRAGPVAKIFEEFGEEHFRELERSVAAEFTGRTGLVISTGGRMMLDQACVACLEPGAFVVCLTAGVETIIERIGETANRPLLASSGSSRPQDLMHKLLAERAEAYGRYTPVDTEGRSPQQVAAEIVSLLEH